MDPPVQFMIIIGSNISTILGVQRLSTVDPTEKGLHGRQLNRARERHGIPIFRMTAPPRNIITRRTEGLLAGGTATSSIRLRRLRQTILGPTQPVRLALRQRRALPYGIWFRTPVSTGQDISIHRKGQ